MLCCGRSERETPHAAAGPRPRHGNWDPVRGYQFMNHNVRRFMSLWECPKPAIAEIAGWAVGGATDLVMCANLLFMADDAHTGYAPTARRIGLVSEIHPATDLSAAAEAEEITENGLREVIADRDRPWKDYGQSPR